MEVVNLEQIKAVLDIPVAMKMIEEGFVALATSSATVPPVGYLGFKNPPGDCHIKYGYIHGDNIFVLKLATGFFENPSRGLPTPNGLMLVMSAETGAPLALLNDSGYLTEVRTALAGAIAARYLAPEIVQCIGIVGAGYQAEMQLDYLRYATDCRKAMVWARRPDKAAQYQRNMREHGFDVRVAGSIQDLCAACNLIVTATPATTPVIQSDWIQPGTHITAMGSDSVGKQELDSAIFKIADVCAVDSLSQCLEHGESHFAVADKHIAESELVELGAIITGEATGRSNQESITIADLTGVAVQDIQIAKSVWTSISGQNGAEPTAL